MKIAHTLTLLLLIGLPLACKNAPRDAYYRTVQAAKLGEREAFLDGFTKKSAKLIRAVLVLSESMEFVKAPYRHLVFEKVLKVTKRTIATADEARFNRPRVDDASDDSKDPPKEFEVAILTVSKGNAKDYILMVTEGGKWKIDAWRMEFMRRNARYRDFILGKKDTSRSSRK